MYESISEIITLIEQVAVVPGIIANFVFAMPWWFTGGLAFAVVLGVALLLLRLVGVN